MSDALNTVFLFFSPATMRRGLFGKKEARAQARGDVQLNHQETITEKMNDMSVNSEAQMLLDKP